MSLSYSFQTFGVAFVSGVERQEVVKSIYGISEDKKILNDNKNIK